jgi:uncharacterized membrane protein YdjX (TVP38/TMEM64 family)
VKRQERIKILFNRQNALALAILLLCLAVCYWLLNPQVNILTPEGFRQTVKNLGLLGPFVYIAILALSVVISPIPSAPLAVMAGTIWGAFLAGIYSIIGGFIGGLIAYFLGRTLARSAIKALTGKIIYFSKNKGETYLSWLIFITRMLPIFSFDLISYAAGIAGISLPKYTLATFLGMIPSTFLLTYMGGALSVGTPLGIAISVIFLIVIIVLPWLIRRHNWLGMRDIVRVE